MGEYAIRCTGCKKLQPPFAFSCPEDQGLLRTKYSARRITPRNLPGIWRYIDWLPLHEPMEGVGAKSVTYKSHGLARELGLDDLYVSFSGYWPEKSAAMATCSFKDLEAAPTMQRLVERDGGVLVVASAGNTARAFAHVASAAGLPLVLVVPLQSLHRLWTTIPEGPVCLVGVEGDYYDSIVIAEKIAAQDGFEGEGGARNVARRDGMGTVMVDAALTIGEMPDHYFQAVGSGTGGIAAWEACIRLIEDGRFGSIPSRLHLAQNLPCAPIFASWHGLEPTDRGCPGGMYDDVLFNRRPPFGMPGGVADALATTDGDVYGVDNVEAEAAGSLFEGTEDIDILPAASVAVAALVQAVESGTLAGDDTVLLNVTGGGLSRLREDLATEMLEMDVKARPGEPLEEIMAAVGDVLEGKGA